MPELFCCLPFNFVYFRLKQSGQKLSSFPNVCFLKADYDACGEVRNWPRWCLSN